MTSDSAHSLGMSSRPMRTPTGIGRITAILPILILVGRRRLNEREEQQRAKRPKRPKWKRERKLDMIARRPNKRSGTKTSRSIGSLSLSPFGSLSSILGDIWRKREFDRARVRTMAFLCCGADVRESHVSGLRMRQCLSCYRICLPNNRLPFCGFQRHWRTDRSRPHASPL